MPQPPQPQSPVPWAAEIPDLVELEVPVGGRVLVVSDLRLGGSAIPESVGSTTGLSEALESATGPGILVIAGNLFESGVEPRPALEGHHRLAGDIRDYAAGPGRWVVVLPGDRDSFLAWSPAARSAVAELLGAEIALAADLTVATGAGVRRVRVEPGHNLDPLAGFNDPRDPLETPFGQHVREELLPAVLRRQAGGRRRRRSSSWLQGMEQLDEPAAISRFIASRLVYRRFLRVGWLLLIPLIMALVLRIPSQIVFSARHGALTTRLGLFVAVAFLEFVLLLVLALAAIRVTNRALSAIALDEGDPDRNQAPRSAARELVTSGYAGLVTGHTCRPELTRVGPGFYANTGATADVVSEHQTALAGLGLPTVFVAHRLAAWIELEAGSELHVRLLHAGQDLPGSSLLEKLIARRSPSWAAGDLRASVVASFPQGESWPAPPSSEVHDRRIRRATAAMVVAVGFLSLVSAMSEPLRNRLNALQQIFPIQIPETAAAIAVLAGVALVMLARGIRRGQRRAWAVTELLLLAVAVLHVVKGVDVEEALIVLLLAGFLWVHRASFRARSDFVRMRRGLLLVLGAALLTILAGTVAVELSTAINHTRHHIQPRVPWAVAFRAALGRMVGLTGTPLPEGVDDFLTPTMIAATAGLVLAFVAVLFRPVVGRRLHEGVRDGSSDVSTEHGSDGLTRARSIVARHASGTLDYFALRRDKDFFFWGDTLVAYAVYNGVCLVSPDPIGPVAEREEAWRRFRRFVDGHGWALGGLGAGEDWLPIYRATGMHDLYVGDEAVVRVGRFTLEGGRFKGLRQAVNRIAKYGYRISFHDPADLDPVLDSQLRDVMTKSRRGDVERGFSMTLGRVFDPTDRGLLLAVVHGPCSETSSEGSAHPDSLGPPVAFCQYVPAPGIGGYSLDLMRRDDGEHPNGLIDFAVVETIKELKARGDEGLGLNFATMRAVLAGEAGEGMTQKVQSWVLRRMSDSMQIESLWKFNAKFDPDWQPRYAVYDAPENLVGVALAVARAESFWELPVIGRFLVPSGEQIQDKREKVTAEG
jgi:lysylphosphatidylglycerol synthetase-like protein (DUF2156 family)